MIANYGLDQPWETPAPMDPEFRLFAHYYRIADSPEGAEANLDRLWRWHVEALGKALAADRRSLIAELEKGGLI